MIADGALEAAVEHLTENTIKTSLDEVQIDWRKLSMIAQEAIPEAVPVEIVNEEDVPVESVDEAPTDTVTLEDAPKDVQTEDAATESVQEPAPVFEEQKIVDEPVVKQKAVEPVTVEEKTVEPVTVETVIVEEKTVEPVIEAPAVIEDKTVEEPVEKPKSKPHADKRLSFRPLARKLSQGPPVAISSITAQVFKTNPVLEEVLLSLEMIEKNDPSMDHFDIKDFQFFSSAHVQSLAASLITNTHLKKINMSNVKLSTPDCVILAKALAKNEGVEILNLESNQIGPQGMRELALALGTNKSLQQLLLSHQKSITPPGNDAEQCFASSLQKNTVLTKLGLQFRSAAYRNQVDRLITRNKEIARKLRLASKREE